MSMQYIRRYYGVPAKRGMRVVAIGKPGVITGSDDARLRIRLDGESRSGIYHPTWEITYLTESRRRSKSRSRSSVSPIGDSNSSEESQPSMVGGGHR